MGGGLEFIEVVLESMEVVLEIIGVILEFIGGSGWMSDH